MRKPLDRLEASDIEKVVDKRVRVIIKEDRGKEVALKKEKEALKRQLNNAEENEEALIREKMDVLNKKI
ncbi:MAG: hypothetical protein MI975_00170, partial [Cytophagales bacterium]|nr:hypothetical protein [Cytophagales bacterium]